MTLANIPDTDFIVINRDKAIDMLLVSIALVEISLSRIINAVAEKIQLITGIIPGITPALSISEILAIDRSVQDILACVAENEATLHVKLGKIFSAAREAAGEKVLEARLPG